MDQWKDDSGLSFIWNDQIHIDLTLLTNNSETRINRTVHSYTVPRENKACNLCRYDVGNKFHYLFLCAHPNFTSFSEGLYKQGSSSI